VKKKISKKNQKKNPKRTSHWDYRKIHLCSIWLKIGMLVDFEVQNNVLMDFKPLSLLLDPHSGHRVTVGEKPNLAIMYP
jgi:predicted phosphatase